MQLSLSIEESDQILNLEISSDLTLKEVRNLISFEVDYTDFDIYFNGSPLSDDSKTLKLVGFGEDELVVVRKKQKRQQQQRPVVDHQLSSQRDPQQSKIDEALEHALENTPEIFGSVSMLYINLTLNGTPVKAFVDSGAQQTIISTRLASQCDLTSLIDKRFQGLAMGVGSSKIEGRIHSAMIKIETQFLPVSFAVIDTHVDFLLGLDMLRRYQGIIDLEKNVLRLADVETRFLGESEIPKGNVFNPSAGGANSGLGQNIFTPGSNTGVSTSQSTTKNTTTDEQKIPNNRNNVTKFPESSIIKLINLGASRSDAISLLTQTDGNVEVAASLLFQ